MSCRLTIDPAAGTALLALDRGDHRNALSPEMVRSLATALEEVEVDANVGAVVLAGEGPAFCVGGDLGAFAEELAQGTLRRRLERDTAAFNPFIERLVQFPLPVVAALHGAVAGAGLALAAACDLRVCGPSTVFAAGFSGIGLPPDTGTSWLLPRLMGQGRAADFLLRNRRLDAQEALAAGLVNEVIDDPRSRAMELAAELASGPRRALADTKRLLADAPRQSLSDQLEAERAGVLRAAVGPELPEGVAAFLAKRRPVFPA